MCVVHITNHLVTHLYLIESTCIETGEEMRTVEVAGNDVYPKPQIPGMIFTPDSKPIKRKRLVAIIYY